MDIMGLSAEDLIDEFKWAVCRDHYDPCGDMRKPDFSQSQLYHEIMRRMEK